MSAEHLSQSPERSEQDNAELEAARAERLAEVREAAGEHDPADHAEVRAERAREVINQHEDQPEPETETKSEATPPAKHPLHILDHHLNYSRTMASVQRRLGPVSRGFSKVIHAPAVEKTSEALEHTVARPSVLLGTTWTALIVGGIFYFTARHYGFSLSGSELLFSFIVGALLGLVLEGIWHALTIKRRK